MFSFTVLVNAKARNCVAKITVYSITSCQSALDHRLTFLGGFLLIVAFRSQSSRTILWSEIPGMEMQALTSEGSLQQKRSSRFWP